MKKSLLIASALLMSGSMFAETNLYMGDVKMEAGKSYTCNEITEGLMSGYQIDPKLSVMSDKDTEFTFAFECTTGQIIQFCGQGTCTNLVKDSYTGNLTANQKWNAMLEYLEPGAATPEAMAKNITLDLKLDNQSFTLVLNSSEGKVAMIQKDRNVAFSNNALVYSLSGNANAVVYDMQGRKVLSTTLNGSGSLDLNTLGRGAYIYRIGTVSGKVLVK